MATFLQLSWLAASRLRHLSIAASPSRLPFTPCRSCHHLHHVVVKPAALKHIS